MSENYVQRLSVIKTAVGDLLDFHQRLILTPISLLYSLKLPHILLFGLLSCWCPKHPH